MQSDICADPEIDILYVGTITALHVEHALMALPLGAHLQLAHRARAAEQQRQASRRAVHLERMAPHGQKPSFVERGHRAEERG